MGFLGICFGFRSGHRPPSVFPVPWRSHFVSSLGLQLFDPVALQRSCFLSVVPLLRRMLHFTQSRDDVELWKLISKVIHYFIVQFGFAKQSNLLSYQ